MPFNCRYCAESATHKVTFREGFGFVAWLHVCAQHLEAWAMDGAPKAWAVEAIEPIKPSRDDAPEDPAGCHYCAAMAMHTITVGVGEIFEVWYRTCTQHFEHAMAEIGSRGWRVINVALYEHPKFL